jgi:cytochrome c
LQAYRRPLTLVVAFTLLVSCGSESEDARSNEKSTPLLSAATLGEQTVLTVPGYLAQEKFVAADTSNGHRQVQICKACHSLDQGGPNMIGPALFGFFGRNVGGQAGFDYSPVMRNANFVWTPRALDAWLAQPGHFLPGNRMIFAGVMGQKDRDDLVAYLLEVTSTSATE